MQSGGLQRQNAAAGENRRGSTGKELRTRHRVRVCCSFLLHDLQIRHCRGVGDHGDPGAGERQVGDAVVSALSRDKREDFRKRVGIMFVGRSESDSPVTVEDLCVGGVCFSFHNPLLYFSAGPFRPHE